MTQTGSSLYVGAHNIPIYHRNGFFEERNLNITITDNGKIIQIKLRDPMDYCFNFTENVAVKDFDVIRANQSLDINYVEFKTNIVDMLNQLQTGEMSLKCEVIEKTSTLTFYTKSKIKNIVFLTLELHTTNQTEIISEMYLEINEVQEVNKGLQKQVSKYKKQIQGKETEIQNMEMAKNIALKHFHKTLQNIDQLFTSKLDDLQNEILNKILEFNSQIRELHRIVVFIKKKNDIGILANNSILEKYRNLQRSYAEKDSEVQQLKNENTSLNILRVNLERNIADLKRSGEESKDMNTILERKNHELEDDLKKMSIIITQRESKIAELSKDLVQANNMLVGFNQQYDSKSQQVEDLENALLNIEKLLQKEKDYTNKILKSYEEYKNTFSCLNFESLKRELKLSSNRNEELQEDIRKLNKMNALLSQKVGQGYFNVR